MALALGTNSGFVTVAPTTDPTGGATSAIDGTAMVSKHTTPANASLITEIGWWRDSGTDTANFEIGLYSDAAGVADALLYVERTNSSSATGWITRSVSWPISPSTPYWLAVQMDNHAGTSNIDTESGVGAGRDAIFSATTLNNPYGGGAVAAGSGCAAIYALVELFISGTLSGTESGSDTAAIAGDVAVVGAIAATETGGDTAQIAGSVPANDITGVLAVTESGQDTAQFLQSALAITDRTFRAKYEPRVFSSIARRVLTNGARRREVEPLWSGLLPRISVSGKNLMRGARVLNPFGFQQTNFFHLVDYFTSTGQQLRDDMAVEMRANRQMGANVYRVNMDLWRFIEGPNKNALTMKPQPLANFLYLLQLAQDNQTYLMPCFGNTWQPAIIPAWYDALPYADRWDVQEYFWTQIATEVVASGNAAAVLAYELMNEPSISTDPDEDWYGEDTFGIGIHYEQIIAKGPEVDDDTTRDWITQLSTAIKAVDTEALVTVGTYPFATGPFGVENIQDLLDFVSPHLYPPIEILGETLAGQLAYVTAWAAADTPVVCGETVAWSAVQASNVAFFNALSTQLQGVIGFSYGYPPEEFTTPPDAPLYPAPDDADPGVYALQGSAQQFFLTYRDDIVG